MLILCLIFIIIALSAWIFELLRIIKEQDKRIENIEIDIRNSDTVKTLQRELKNAREGLGLYYKMSKITNEEKAERVQYQYKYMIERDKVFKLEEELKKI